MSLVLLLLIIFLLWRACSSSSSRNTHTPTRSTSTWESSGNTRTSPAVTRDQAELKTAKPSSLSYGPSNSRTPNVLRKPAGDCICGCNGLPLTLLPDYSIDYESYKICPARLKRKLTGRYIDDSGQVRDWIPGSTAGRWTPSSPPRARKKTKKQIARERRAARSLEIQERDQDRKTRRQLKDRQEQERITNDLPARGAAEAERRGLDTYIGKDCKLNHGGKRWTRNGECVECRKDAVKLRDAMRRGAYPRDLTTEEKKRISEIYAESKRRTKETGIQHHVDHVKPLAAGGEHHPDNLQILTADENLRKGSSWEE